ncbi:MAG: SDR family oxidoreductase [Halobacteria archaeon]|nr:SDR family oxidoreductase [Halobacteria archaeon]
MAVFWDMELEGKNVLVTGSAKRVGRHIALRLADGGANVAVNYRTSDDEAEETAEEIREKGVEAATVQADLSNLEDIQRLVDTVVEEFGSLDVLVNNASVFYPTPFGEVTEEDWDKNLDVNLKGPFFCSQYSARAMMENATEPKGKIVSIADWSGFRPYTRYLPYCISKAGIIAMTRGLAKELAPQINVNAIAPGPVMLPPDFSEEEKKEVLENTPLQRVGSPDDIAEGVAFMVEGSDFVTGAILPIDGGRLIA